MTLDACVDAAVSLCHELGPWGAFVVNGLLWGFVAWRQWLTHRKVKEVAGEVSSMGAKVEALSTPPPPAPTFVERLSIPVGVPQPPPALPKDLLPPGDKGEPP